MQKWLLAALIILHGGPVFAQGADVALSTQVSGPVTYTAGSGPTAQPVQAFMRLREGDRVTLADGAQLRVVFLDGAQQERWMGPGAFRIGKRGSEPVSGKPVEVTKLPVGVPKRMAQVPELLQGARISNLGGVQVRGSGARTRKPTLEQQVALEDARAVYATMRKTSDPDDIAPELFFYAALNEYQLHGEMGAVVDEMMRKQPRNEDLKVLADWVRARTRP